MDTSRKFIEIWIFSSGIRTWLSIYLSVCVCLSICLSACPSDRLSVCPFVRLSVCRLPVCPVPIWPSAHLSVCLSVCDICPSMLLSVNPSVCLSMCLSVQLFVRSPVCLSVWKNLKLMLILRSTKVWKIQTSKSKLLEDMAIYIIYFDACKLLFYRNEYCLC